MAKIEGILEEIKSLTVVELNELVKAIEEEFGVSAAAMAFAGPAGGGGGADSAAEEKSEVAINLVEVGGNKMAVIKLVKEVTGLGLKEAKDIVDNAPKTVKENVPIAEAQEIKKKFEEAGAKVELK